MKKWISAWTWPGRLIDNWALATVLILIGGGVFLAIAKGINQASGIPTLVAALAAGLVVAHQLSANRREKLRDRDLQRENIQKAVEADIRAILVAIEMTHLVQDFCEKLRTPTKKLTWADAPRHSDYFQLYGAVSQELGALEHGRVDAVVSFYTFLKAARDAAEPLSIPNLPEKSVQLHICNVLLLMRQVLKAGREALQEKGQPTSPLDDSLTLLISKIDEICGPQHMLFMTPEVTSDAP